MAAISKFEDIQAWQKARELTREIYKVSRSGEFARDFGLKDQVRRAAVSVMANIAEGFERQGDREFLQFLALAKGSASEVRSHLYVALDAGFIESRECDRLQTLSNDVVRLIGGFMRYLTKSPYTGAKLRPREDPGF